MKKVIGIIILLTFLFGCKKEESGTLIFRMKYSTSQDENKSLPLYRPSF
jgi:hypothetical protein